MSVSFTKSESDEPELSRTHIHKHVDNILWYVTCKWSSLHHVHGMFDTTNEINPTIRKMIISVLVCLQSLHLIGFYPWIKKGLRSVQYRSLLASAITFTLLTISIVFYVYDIGDLNLDPDYCCYPSGVPHRYGSCKDHTAHIWTMRHVHHCQPIQLAGHILLFVFFIGYIYHTVYIHTHMMKSEVIIPISPYILAAIPEFLFGSILLIPCNFPLFILLFSVNVFGMLVFLIPILFISVYMNITQYFCNSSQNIFDPTAYNFHCNIKDGVDFSGIISGPFILFLVIGFIIVLNYVIQINYMHKIISSKHSNVI